MTFHCRPRRLALRQRISDDPVVQGLQQNFAKLVLPILLQDDEASDLVVAFEGNGSYRPDWFLRRDEAE